jgi:Ssp1 endopeptidase immunity protein Rap1a
MITALLLLTMIAPAQAPSASQAPSAASQAPSASQVPSASEMETGKGLLWACSRLLSTEPRAWDFPEGLCLGQLRSIQGMIEISRLRADENLRRCNSFCDFVNSKSPISPPHVCSDVCDLSKGVSKIPICLPEKGTLRDAASAVVSYLEANPSEQTKAATTVALDALVTKFPCPH